MADYKKRDARAEDDAIDALLSLPTRNLESRIRLLDDERQQRLILSDELVAGLDRQRRTLEEHSDRMRYLGIDGEAMKARGDVRGKLLRLEELKHLERVASFRDDWELREKLQGAHEELATAKQRLRLAKS